MPTTFVYTTFAVITVLNGAGQLAPVDKSELPAPYNAGPIHFSEGACLMTRGKMEHPEKYFCQVFTSPKTTQWVYVPPGAVPAADPPEGDRTGLEPSKKALDDVRVGPTKLETKDAPKPDASADPTPKEIAKPKRVAQQPRYDQQAMVEGRQTMFEGNPLTGFFSW
jgi:hypothetical protein